MEVLFKSSGTLRYGQTNLVLDVDQGLPNFHKALLPKWIRVNSPMYPAHISIVRKETPKYIEYWHKYTGEEVEFLYSNKIRTDGVYYWIDCWSKRLEEIRIELGLINNSLYIVPPTGFIKTFHITVANTKG